MDNENYTRVRGTQLIRNKHNKSIINTNESERQQYLARKKSIQAKNDRIDSLEKRVADLESQIKVLMAAK